MKIVLTSPGNIKPKGIRLEAQVPFAIENLALGYIGGRLRKSGHQVSIIDGYAELSSPQDIAKRLVDSRSEVIGITVLQSTATITKDVCAHIKKSGFKGCIILGGWLPSLSPEQTLKYIDGADYLIRGEGEDAFLLFLDALTGKAKYNEVPGLWLRMQDSVKLVGEKEIAIANDYEKAPFPWHYLYDQQHPQNRLYPAPIQGSRGCNWGHCTFCSTRGLYGSGNWRHRPASSIIDEISFLIDTYAIKDYFFIDDCFLGPHPQGMLRAREFIALLHERCLEINFAIDCRVNDVSKDLFISLKEVGLRRIYLGIESGVDSILERFRKGYTSKQVIETICLLESLEIDYIPGYILFEPYMSMEEVRDNANFMLKYIKCCDPTKFFKRIIPEIGTELFDKLEKDSLLLGEFPNYSFIYRDAKVGKLYQEISNSLKPIINEYISMPKINNRQDSVRQLTEKAYNIFLKTWESISNE